MRSGLKRFVIMSSIRSVLVVGILFSSHAFGDVADAEVGKSSVALDFGFPRTPHKRAFDTCAELWGHLEFLCGPESKGRHAQEQHMPIRQRETAVRLALGDAAYLHSIVESLSQAQTLSRDDCSYLVRMVDQTMDQCSPAPEWSNNEDRLSVIQKFLRATRNHCVDIHSFKGDDTVLGPRE